MIYHRTGTYWTIEFEPAPPPAPCTRGAWLVKRRMIKGWKPYLSTADLRPDPETDPVVGPSYRWVMHGTAHSCKQSLRFKYGPVAVCCLYHDPRTGKRRRAWIASPQ